MHKIQIAFGNATGPGDVLVPVKVILDDRELQGVRSVVIALDDAGVTSVVLTLVSSTTADDNPPQRTVKGGQP